MERTQQIELTNMCLIYDEKRVLVQEKTGTSHEGDLVFPGGHVEAGESGCWSNQEIRMQIRFYMEQNLK
jgi:hypothetical protein